jgi:hypothetical protein
MRLPSIYITRALLPAALLAVALAACGAPATQSSAPASAPATTSVPAATAEQATAQPTSAPTSAPTAQPTVAPTAGPQPTEAPAEAGVLPRPLYFLGGGQEAQGQIFRIERDGVTVTKITDEQPASPDILAITEFAISPADGSLVYTLQGNNGNLLIQTDKQGKNRIVLMENVSVSRPRWSPDGKSVAVQVMRPDALAGAGNGVYLVPAGGGEPKLLQAEDPVADPMNPPAEVRGYAPEAWSPDGKQLILSAYSRAVELCEVVVKDLDSGKLVKLQPANRMTTSCGSGRWNADGSAIYVGMTRPGYLSPVPGLWVADPASGATQPFVNGTADSGQFTLVNALQPAEDGSIYAFLGTTDKLPDPGVEPAVELPKFEMYRVSASGEQTKLRDEAYDTYSGFALWADDGSGALIQAVPNQNGEAIGLKWLPANGGPAVEIPAGSQSLAWGS